MIMNCDEIIETRIIMDLKYCEICGMGTCRETI